MHSIGSLKRENRVAVAIVGFVVIKNEIIRDKGEEKT